MSMCCVTMYIYKNNIIYQTDGVCFTHQEWNAATSQIRRIVEPVFVQLRWGDQGLPGTGILRMEDQLKTRLPWSVSVGGTKPLAVPYLVDHLPTWKRRWALWASPFHGLKPMGVAQFLATISWPQTGIPSVNLTMENQHLKYSNLHMGHFQSTGGFSEPFWPRPQLQTFIFRR